jgi:hypothetical protein
MSRITVAEAKNILCRTVDNGVPPDDPRVIHRINEATERLMAGGHWVGMTQELTICTQQQCFSLPRQIESVQEIFIQDPNYGTILNTMDVTSGWYAVENPATYVDPDFLNDVVLVDRGEYPTLFDICTPGQLIVFTDYTEAAGSSIRILGLDATGNEIYTEQDGSYAAGEVLVLSTDGTTSVNTFSKITNMQKAVTQGPVRVYEVDPSGTGNHIMLAILDPTEIVPSYRRYFCADIPVVAASDPPIRIRTTGKRRFLPVSADTDFLIISNTGALRLELLAIDREDGNDFQGSAEFHKRALDLLQAEAKTYQQDPTRVSYRKAQCIADEQSFDRKQLGYVRARLALENPQFMRVGLRNITRAINTSQERLLSQGYWKDTVIYLTLKIFGDGYVVVPPNVEALTVIHYLGLPLTLRNRWFESHEASVGLKSKYSNPVIACLDHGTGPGFFELERPINLTVGSTVAADNGNVFVRISGTDHEGNEVWMPDPISGVNIPAETVYCGNASTTLFQNVTRIAKPLVAQGNVIIWAGAHTFCSIAPPVVYPNFHRFFIPGLGDKPLPYDKSAVFVQAKLKYQPAELPEDFLIVTNYAALKEMLFAIASEEGQKLDVAGAHEQRAIKILNDELRAHRGPATPTVNIQMRGWLRGWRYRQPI